MTSKAQQAEYYGRQAEKMGFTQGGDIDQHIFALMKAAIDLRQEVDTLKADLSQLEDKAHNQEYPLD